MATSSDLPTAAQGLSPTGRSTAPADAPGPGTTPDGPAPADLPTVRRVTLATAIGQFVEFYDYAVYGVLAATLATVFFPEESATAALLLTFSVFAVSFVVRPLGGVLFGVMGDRYGRRRALVTILTVMGAATVAIGLLPGYAAIGIAAPILLILFRLLQGVSAGGEVAGGDSFVAEYAPEGRRGAYTAWGQFGAYTALLVGTGLGVLLTQGVGEEGLTAWGWRVPFLLAAPMALIGFYIRRRLQDTPAFVRLEQQDEAKTAALGEGRSRNPLREALSSPRRRAAIALAIAIPVLNSSGYYVLLAYMPTYLSESLHFSGAQSQAVTASGLLGALIAIPLAGRLSDRVGRKPVLAGSAIALAVLGYPYYWVLNQGIPWLAVLAGVLMAVVFAGHAGVIGVFLVELFPTRVRYTSYSLGYNVSTMLFGGAAPLLMTWLIDLTGDPSVPAYYMIGTALVTAVALTRTQERAHLPLRDDWDD